MSRSRRRQLHLLFVLMILNTVAELGTIGAVLPLLSLIGHSEGLQNHPGVLALLQAIGGSSQAGLVTAATAIFSSFAVAAGILRLQLASSSFNFAYGFAHELTLEIQRRLLFQPYAFHVQRNTSTLVSSLEKANILVFDVVLPLIQALSGAFIALFIIAALIAVDPVTAVIAATLFTAIYALISVLTKGRLATNSAVISKAIDERLKVVQESLGGIRDVKIDGSHSTYLALFDRENGKLGRARANTAIISAAPRYLTETIGIVAIAIIALLASQRQGGFGAALPALGAIALGAQRLLPLIQQVYRGWSNASGHLSVVDQTVSLLTLPIDEEPQEQVTRPPLPLRKKISVQDLSFTYPARRSAALERISFEVPAGSALALTGETGSGKSTLADLLMGLLEPDQGRICIDGVQLTKDNCRRWQRSIAHVPQSIFLTDATIAHNIALSLPRSPADHDRLVEAARKAQLHDFIVSLPRAYDTLVGERGIRLSGGQRQRLGIARAIYKDAPVLILDEATNALDHHTEAAVISALEELRRDGRTIIIVAHRRSTVCHCDFVARLEHGRLAAFGRVEEILAAYENLS
jgi:ATP-binding cassette subfamily B protein